jgi:SH3-like domain-containing protein
MRYPVDKNIKVTQGHHQGKCLDFGWTSLMPGAGATQPIYAVDNATVYSVENQPNGGLVIYLKHDDGKCSCYAHLSKALVKKSQKVKLGEQIGNMGKSGNSTGPHLHFGLFTSVSVRYKNSTLDPFKYLEVYDGQTVATKTQEKYGSQIKYHPKEVFKYVYNVDWEGLVVRKEPNGASTGKLLQAGTKVQVFETNGLWSRIGDKQWVYSAYLSNKEPKTKVVYNVKNPPLNVRVKPDANSKIIGGLKNGDRVQVYKTKKGWCKVAPKEEAWVAGNYLK